MLYTLSYLAALVALALLLWLPGALIAGRTGLAGRLAGDRALAEICLGLAAWTATLFALAATGLLRPWAFSVVVGLLLATAFLRRRSLGAAALSPRLPRAGDLLAGGFLAVFLAAFFLLALTPTVSWDAAVYHLALPKLYLAAGGFTEVPFNVYSHWPQGVELLFAAAMLVKDYVLAKSVHFGFALLIVYALLHGGRRLARGGQGAAAGWLAAFLFLANPVVAFEMRVAYVDLAHAFFVLAAFLFMERARVSEPGDAGTPLLLAGVAGGLAAGVKLTGVVAVAAVGTLWLPRLLGRSREWRPFLLRYAVPAFLLWLPWPLKSWWETGNPFYPLFHGIFGGKEWSAELAGQLATWQESIGMGREPLDYLLLLPRVILAGGQGYESFDGRLGAFWAVLLPLALAGAVRLPTVRRALAVAGLLFGFWAATSQQMRLLLPALPLVALAAALSVAALLARVERSALRRAAAAGLLISVALLLVVGSRRELTAAPKAFAAYQRDGGAVRQAVVAPVYRYIAEELPADARLLLINANQGFFVDRAYLADSFFEASQIADWLRPARSASEARRLLKEKGITHILVHRGSWGIEFSQGLQNLLVNPRQVQGVFRTKDGEIQLLELR